jgi:methylenetetrahydrofolate dehydrogenase (NADP+) / methenyltetrahydrofolate cyclohydrolase
MTANIILGKQLQQQLIAEPFSVATRIGIKPTVCLISVENVDPMLPINRGLHLRTFQANGVACDNVVLPMDTSMETLSLLFQEKNLDPAIHGVMVLLPLPEHLSIREILPLIDAAKELEGLHPEHSAALLTSNTDRPGAVKPLVGEAIVLTLKHQGIPLEHQNIVVVTEEKLMRDNPIANMIVRCAAAAMFPVSSVLTMVPIEHPQARALAAEADLLIVSLERPAAVGADWVKPGATVIDFNPSLIGFKEQEGRAPVPLLQGGVDNEPVAAVAGHLMPVPGGVGPVMLGILMRNLAHAALRSDRKAAPVGSTFSVSDSMPSPAR